MAFVMTVWGQRFGDLGQRPNFYKQFLS